MLKDLSVVCLNGNLHIVKNQKKFNKNKLKNLKKIVLLNQKLIHIDYQIVKI